MNKRTTYIVVFSLLAIGLLLILFWDRLFPKKETCPDNLPVPTNGVCLPIPSGVTNYSNTTVSGCIKPTSYVENDFPIKKGMKGQRVRFIQEVLKVSADGFFGCNTEDALFKKYKVKEVSEVLYNTAFGPI